MRRALVVDDSEENLYYVATLLKAQGYTVETARHGAEALVKGRESPPSVVISDLLMPVMDGYTLLRHWKADARLRDVPFVVYTATYTEPEDEQLARSFGADAFILKPAEPGDFIARISAARAGTASNLQAPGTASDQGEGERLREYSQVLIRKLEEKMLQLEQRNRDLQRDIAAREQAELALRESEARFRQLAESIDDVFWLSDAQSGQMLYVSPAYSATWGRSGSGLQEDPLDWLAAVHPEDRARMAESQQRPVTDVRDETYRIVLGDGSTRWIRSRAFPVHGVDGAVCRTACVSRDITDYRRLEDQFRQVQRMEAVGRLAGGIAHDFNNLLSVILGYASLTLDGSELAIPVRANLEEILRAGERARDLTQQLLAFSRQQVLHPRALDLSAIVGDMERMLQRVLGEDILLSLVIPADACIVHADASQVEQIVMNLVVNARDAMRTGGKLTIEVERAQVDESYAAGRIGLLPGAYVMLVVSDTGEGMDAATCESAFEPFFTTKEQGKGTGLGLSTVFGIVKQSRGDIHVYSEPSVGTTFKVYLPCSSGVPQAQELTPPAPATLRGSETVLLVEDDEQLRAMNSSILRKHGYEVLEAQNGTDAFLLSERYAGEIQLLLSDVVMPRMSGRELAARIGAMRPRTKILFISGYTENSATQHGVLQDGIELLPKPITPQALLRKVRQALDASASLLPP